REYSRRLRTIPDRIGNNRQNSHPHVGFMKRSQFAEPGVGACASTVSISRRSAGRPAAGRPPWREELRSAIWGDQRRSAAVPVDCLLQAVVTLEEFVGHN